MTRDASLPLFSPDNDFLIPQLRVSAVTERKKRITSVEFFQTFESVYLFLTGNIFM